MASPSLALPPTWQVRITAPDGTVAGGGVLVPGNRVLTCVHVVNAALRRVSGSRPPEPEQPVYVDVPHHAQYRRRCARVIDASWNIERDTTLLRLDEGPMCAAARLSARTAEITASHQPYPVRVRGYPRSNAEGLSVTAWVIAPGGDLPQRAQVDIDVRHPARFEPGFSGCGVLDTRDGSVIGILTSALQDTPDSGGRLSERHGRIGLMEPVEMVEPLSEHLGDPELDEVRRVLSDVLFEGTLEAYIAATRHRATRGANFTSAWEAFAELRELTPRPDGLPCEVVFVEEIARKGVIAPQVLRAYSDSRYPSEVPREALEQLREAGTPTPPKAASLIISADPVPGDPDAPQAYLVSHWVRDGQGVSKGSPSRISEQELRDTVLQLIDDTEARLHSRDFQEAVDLRLEFILPFPLLTQPIAQWRLSAPITGEGERIGASYEILLHSQERLNDPGWERARRKILHRWQEMIANGAGRLLQIPPGPDTGTGTPLNDRLAGPGIVLCVLGDAPDPGARTRQLGAALQAGLPAIAWLRNGDEQETRRFHDRMSTIPREDGDTISPEDIASLPRLLREWRTQSGEPDEEGYDPYDVIVILDNMPQIRDLHHVGILTSPKKSDDND